MLTALLVRSLREATPLRSKLSGSRSFSAAIDWNETRLNVLLVTLVLLVGGDDGGGGGEGDSDNADGDTLDEADDARHRSKLDLPTFSAPTHMIRTSSH